MNTIFMNSGNSKTSHPHRLSFNLKDKTDLKRKDKYIALSNLSIYYTSKNTKKSYKNDKFRTSAPTWNEKFDLPYSTADILDYFEYILKKHWEKTVNLSIKRYISKTENRITFKIKTGYYVEPLTPETIKLLGSTKSKITNTKMVNMYFVQKLLKLY